MARIFSPSVNCGNVFLKIFIAITGNNKTPENVPGEYDKLKILKEKCIMPFTSNRDPNAVKSILLLNPIVYVIANIIARAKPVPFITMKS